MQIRTLMASPTRMDVRGWRRVKRATARRVPLVMDLPTTLVRVPLEAEWSRCGRAARLSVSHAHVSTCTAAMNNWSTNASETPSACCTARIVWLSRLTVGAWRAATR